MWPQILEAVKGRRRYSWILLSQNAQIAGFDGGTLRLGFASAGARDNFVNSGSEEVLRQALGESMGVRWKIEAVVDSGGGPPPGGPGGPSGPGGGGGPQPPEPPHVPPAGGGRAAPPPSPSPPPPQAPAQAQPPAPAPVPRPAAPEPQAPPRRAPQEQEPEVEEYEEEYAAIDPEVRGAAASPGRGGGAGGGSIARSRAELIIRELGATVIEELHHE
jgi:DNA polymerase-3 subunit gamma/tau